MTWFVGGFIVMGIIAVVLLYWMFSIIGGWAWSPFFDVLSGRRGRAGGGGSRHESDRRAWQSDPTHLRALAPGNVSANLMTAGLTAGAACSCSDTVGNLKVGHMVARTRENSSLPNYSASWPDR